MCRQIRFRLIEANVASARGLSLLAVLSFLIAVGFTSRAEAYVYWANYGTGDAISRAGLDGTGQDTNFIDGFRAPSSVAVDGTHLYWTTYVGTIGRANLDGTNVDQNFITTDASQAIDLAVDGGHVYWMDMRPSEPNGTIGRASLDGSNVDHTFITTAGHDPDGALAVDDSHIYWTNRYWSNKHTIGRANLDGTGIDQDFFEPPGGLTDQGGGLAVDTEHIYWVRWNVGVIGRADIDGTNADPTFIDPDSAPEDLAVDADHVYWQDAADIRQIGIADIDGTDVRFIGETDSNGLKIGASDVAVDGSHLYWGQAGGFNVGFGSIRGIGRAGLDGSNPDVNFISGPTAPEGVAVDAEHIYWTNTPSALPCTSPGNVWCASTIGRANLDGSEVDAAFIAGANNPWGVAVDDTHVYWTNVGTGTAGVGTIGRADLDGSNVDQSFITGASYPAGLAVGANHIYWANAGAGGVIGRANLDGTGVDQSFIAGAGDLVHLAVDASHLFWANFGGSAIGRAELDGTNVEPAFIITAYRPWGVAVGDGTHIYWTVPSFSGPPAIGRANLDGTNLCQGLISAPGLDPDGVAVDAEGPAATAECPPPTEDPPTEDPPTEDAPPTGESPRSLNTTITKHPSTKTTKRKARFKFRSDSPVHPTFECKVDRKPFKPCDSPFERTVGPGTHRFKVRAIVDGVADPSPAKFKWKVLER